MEESAGLLGWLAATDLAQAMRSSLWMYPIVEIIHILGFVLLVGSVAMFDLRIFGFSKNISIERLGRFLLPWSLLSLMLVVPAGLMMFSAHPHDFIGNQIFLVKLALIATAAVNAVIFHAGVYRFVGHWDTNREVPAAAKAHALMSLLIWIAVISCGRLLAYT